MDLSIVTPATRMRLPSRMPIASCSLVSAGERRGWGMSVSVAHAEAAVDGDDRAGDVSRPVPGQPGPGTGAVGDVGQPAQRALRLVGDRKSTRLNSRH